VRRFLARAASDESLHDQVRRFCAELERSGSAADWQVRQAEQALRLYFVNFLDRRDWHSRQRSRAVEGRRVPDEARDGVSRGRPGAR